MKVRNLTLPLALLAGGVLGAPAAHAATGPVPAAHAAGGDVAAMNPAVVGVSITRTDAALSAAADFVDSRNGAAAAQPLTAARKYLIRSYDGARYLISLPPPAPAAEGRAQAAKFVKLAKSFVKASHRGTKARSRWIRARMSGTGAGAGPAIADNPTAVFNVLTSEYSAATAAVNMYPDTTGTLQSKAKLVLNSALILRNRLVKAIAAAEPPAPAAADGRVHARTAQEEGAPTYGALMPGLVVLIDDEIQQMTALKSSLPQAAQGDFDTAIAADKKIETQVNTLWPPAPAD